MQTLEVSTHDVHLLPTLAKGPDAELPKWSGGGNCTIGFSEERCSRVSPRAAFQYLVEIGANRQSCDLSVTLLLKMVLEEVLGISCGVT